MTIERVEAVTYGVEDVALCTRFWTDAGLELVQSGDFGADFRTPVNQFVHIRRIDDPALPPALVTGSNAREVTWGVDTQQALDALAADLSRDRKVTVDAAGVVHTVDYTGYPTAFKISQKTPLQGAARDVNQLDHIGRRNEGVTPYGRPRPLRLIHVVWDLPNENHLEAHKFYMERLNFRAIDTVQPMGTFYQCEGDIEHHNLLLCHRTNALGLNHVAMEVRDFDDVVESGNYMNTQGWKESRRLGRHNLGSNVFRMFQNPCGGRIEFAADMDRMDKTFKPRVWEKTPAHNLWMLKLPGEEEVH